MRTLEEERGQHGPEGALAAIGEIDSTLSVLPEEIAEIQEEESEQLEGSIVLCIPEESSEIQEEERQQVEEARVDVLWRHAHVPAIAEKSEHDRQAEVGADWTPVKTVLELVEIYEKATWMSSQACMRTDTGKGTHSPNPHRQR